MNKTIQIKRWAILVGVENLDYSNYFIEDKTFETLEEAAEYSKMLNENTISFKTMAIQPVWVTVNVESLIQSYLKKEE